MNRKEAIVVCGLLLASFIGTAFADNLAASSSSGCNSKCLKTELEQLARPSMNGTLTFRNDCGVTGCAPGYYFAEVSYANFGNRTAYNANVTVTLLGVNGGCCNPTTLMFQLGNVLGRTVNFFEAGEFDFPSGPPHGSLAFSFMDLG